MRYVCNIGVMPKKEILYFYISQFYYYANKYINTSENSDEE